MPPSTVEASQIFVFSTVVDQYLTMENGVSVIGTSACGSQVQESAMIMGLGAAIMTRVPFKLMK